VTAGYVDFHPFLLPFAFASIVRSSTDTRRRDLLNASQVAARAEQGLRTAIPARGRKYSRDDRFMDSGTMRALGRYRYFGRITL
jgi:hypothetical protein